MTKTTNTKNTNETSDNKKIVWRLGKLPTIEELLHLVNGDIISKKEAREIMFALEDISNIENRNIAMNSNNREQTMSSTAPGTIRHIKVFPF